jgi:GGDEF domain-containing protein
VDPVRPPSPDPARLVQVVAAFARRATGEFSVDGLLHDLATAAADVLDVDGAGVTHLDGDRMAVAHVLPPSLEPVERAQEEDQDGPCHEAARTGSPVVEEDLAATAARWPRFAERALAAGVHAVAGLPLLGRGRAWGAMDLYRRAPGPFTPAQLDAARVLADVACGYVVMAHDRQVAEAAQRRAAHAATHDALTGLPNRALLHDRLHHAVATTARNGRAMAVVFLDLNGFKQVNDTHGHHAGDELLRRVADRLTTAVRAGDTLARWGGDEFVLVCESLHLGAHPGEGGDGGGPGLDGHALDVIADRLRAALDAPFLLPVAAAPGSPPRRVAVHVGASIGAAACVPTPGSGTDEVEGLLRSADEAMYRAKRARRAGRPPDRGVVTILLHDGRTGARAGDGRPVTTGTGETGA